MMDAYNCPSLKDSAPGSGKCQDTWVTSQKQDNWFGKYRWHSFLKRRHGKNLRDYVIFDDGRKLIKNYLHFTCYEAHIQKPDQYSWFNGLRKGKPFLASDRPALVTKGQRWELGMSSTHPSQLQGLKVMGEGAVFPKRKEQHHHSQKNEWVASRLKEPIFTLSHSIKLFILYNKGRGTGQAERTNSALSCSKDWLDQVLYLLSTSLVLFIVSQVRILTNP